MKVELAVNVGCLTQSANHEFLSCTTCASKAKRTDQDRRNQNGKWPELAGTRS